MILTQAQLAIELGLTDRHLRRWKAEGLPSIGEGRKAVYDLAAVCAWMVRTDRTAPRLEEQMARLSGAPGAAPAPAPAPAATPAAELEPQAHGGALLRFVPPAAPPPPPGQLGPPPEGSAELAQGVLSRRRAWRGAQLALEGVEKRIQSGEIRPSPQHAESLARTARMLTQSVRGDGAATVELTPREMLERALARWIRQWGEDALAELLASARARARAAAPGA